VGPAEGARRNTIGLGTDLALKHVAVRLEDLPLVGMNGVQCWSLVYIDHGEPMVTTG